MRRTTRPKSAAARVVAVAAGVALTALSSAIPPPPIAAGAVLPQLSITLDNGRTTTSAGDVLEYSITVRNLDGEDVVGLAVTQTVPGGLRFESADAEGVLGERGISWSATVPAGGEIVHHSTMTVLDTPAELLRLATVACASTAENGAPIVCASHSDQLPAGAAADAVALPTRSASLAWWWYLTGSFGLVCAGLVVLLAARRHADRRT